MHVGQSQLVYEFGFSGDAEPMLSTLGISGDIDSIGDLTSWAELGYGYFENRVLPHLTTDISLNSCTAQHREAAGIIEGVFTDTQVGGTASPPVPPNCAYLLHKFTNGVGRGKHGRMFVPGIPESKVNPNGSVVIGEQTDINADLALFVSDFPGLFLVVNHGPSGSPSVTFIQSMTVDPMIATQRRRLRP